MDISISLEEYGVRSRNSTARTVYPILCCLLGALIHPLIFAGCRAYDNLRSMTTENGDQGSFISLHSGLVSTRPISFRPASHDRNMNGLAIKRDKITGMNSFQHHQRV